MHVICLTDNQFQGIHSSSETTQNCYLKTMKHVIKSLAGRRLASQRKVFYDVTNSLFVYVVKLWHTHLQEGVARLSRGEEGVAINSLEMGRVCLKSEMSLSCEVTCG